MTGGKGMKARTERGERQKDEGNGGRQTCVQRAEWEHVKLPGERCDSPPKQQSSHLIQRFNEAAQGG